MLTYDGQLDNDFEWALREGSLYFEQKSAVHRTLRRITERLDEAGIAYAVIGDLCMFFHGYRRFTQVVELLVAAERLSQIHLELVGDGYIAESDYRASLRDAENGVRIRFRVSVQHSDRQNSVAYPLPQYASTTIDGVKILNVVPLIELKLALGRASHRRGDLADVDALVRYLSLPQDFAMKLQPQWRRAFHEAWHNAQIAAADDY